MAVAVRTGMPMLDADERRCLVAAMDRVLPGDHTAGATAAHAIGYVDWLLSHDRLGEHVALLKEGLGVVDAAAQARHGRPMGACSTTQQDDVMALVLRAPHQRVQRFGVMLIRLTLTGYLCRPEYGGNRGFVGWNAIGFTPELRPALDRRPSSCS
jgi:gluconate 2-dehydrogenase gamma chain